MTPQFCTSTEKVGNYEGQSCMVSYISGGVTKYGKYENNMRKPKYKAMEQVLDMKNYGNIWKSSESHMEHNMKDDKKTMCRG